MLLIQRDLLLMFQVKLQFIEESHSNIMRLLQIIRMLLIYPEHDIVGYIIMAMIELLIGFNIQFNKKVIN